MAMAMATDDPNPWLYNQAYYNQPAFVQTTGATYPAMQPIYTAGTTNINYYTPPVDASVINEALLEKKPEAGSLEWLRDQVNEVCDLARAA